MATTEEEMMKKQKAKFVGKGLNDFTITEEPKTEKDEKEKTK